jgi:glycosyltransferase involved in cell wall biosynthesis
MRLAIVNLTGGGLSGGYKKYLKNMVPRLAEHNDVDALMCISPTGNNISTWFNNNLTATDFCECSPFTLNHLANIPDRKMTGCLKKFSPDIIFLPVDRYVRFQDLPVVNMVRNMEPFVPTLKGDTLTEILKKFIQKKITCESVRRADHTIAVSGYVKSYLTDALHVPEDKISQVYHGLSSSPTGCGIRPASVPKGWDSDFLFTCGSVRPARGLEDVLDALVDLNAYNPKIKLVIAGETVPGMRKYRDGMERLLASRQLTNNVCWAGSLNDEEIRWCYENCSLFIMTSRIEACPNIAMEAMSNGAISIAADNPPLPEFFSDCAAYYEAGKKESLIKAFLDRIALDSGERRLLSERSRKRSKIFSWNLTADMTMTVLMNVLKHSQTQKHNQQ